MKLRQYLTTIIIIVGIIAGTTAGVWLSRNWKSLSSSNSQPVRNLANASKGAESPQTKGTDNAVVTIEEFADFQCPPCARFHGEIKDFEREYGSKLRVIYRHFPLESHNHSVEAAQASEAAALQGKFWQMYDLLYERQDEWSENADARKVFVEYAKNLNLDVEKFLRDMNAPEIKARIEADKKRGDSIDIQGTPTVFINGREVPSDSMTTEGIKSLINEAIR
jgi:protein-disulfide isomerase